MNKTKKTFFLDKPYIIWSILFIIAPLIMVTYFSFTNDKNFFTFENIESIKVYFTTILNSIIYGVYATIICLIIGYPFAYFISKYSKNGQRMIVLLIMLPMWMNFLIRTYSWMTILGDSGLINTLLSKMGLIQLPLINNGFAVILGMVYNFLPYMILPIYSILAKFDKSLIEAAKDLGSNNFNTFTKVILPISIPGVLSGVTMVFVPCVSTFYITQKLGGGHIVLIGDIIETQFQTANNYHLGASLSFVLMILIFVCLAIMNHFDDQENSVGVTY